VISHSRAGPREVYSAIRGAWKLDLRTDAGGVIDRRELFDFERDPHHLMDVASRHPDEVAELEAAIQSYRQQTHRLRLESAESGVDPRARERLRSLGYVD
jgi:hypothetical protein